MKGKNQMWFSEGTVPGKRYGKVKHCFSIDNLVYKGRSPYQKILIFDNSVYGRVFVLDDIVQLSECDEFVYHEMLTHPMLFSHPNPKKILIIGGGDGGTLRECLKHNPEEIYLVDIDKKIIEIAKKYLKFVSRNAFFDKRVTVVNENGRDFMKRYKEYFDIIIIDGGDPVGPSLTLYEYGFYKDIFRALKTDGMASFQIGSFLDTPLIKNTYLKLKKIFPSAAMLRLTMPSYHCGDYCFMFASKKTKIDVFSPEILKKRFEKSKLKSSLKYYSLDMHRASLVTPLKLKV